MRPHARHAQRKKIQGDFHKTNIKIFLLPNHTPFPTQLHAKARSI
jgi:hypothetical protein